MKSLENMSLGELQELQSNINMKIRKYQEEQEKSDFQIVDEKIVKEDFFIGLDEIDWVDSLYDVCDDCDVPTTNEYCVDEVQAKQLIEQFCNFILQKLLNEENGIRVSKGTKIQYNKHYGWHIYNECDNFMVTRNLELSEFEKFCE